MQTITWTPARTHAVDFPPSLVDDDLTVGYVPKMNHSFFQVGHATFVYYIGLKQSLSLFLMGGVRAMGRP